MEEYWLYLEGDDDAIRPVFADDLDDAIEKIENDYKIKLVPWRRNNDPILARGSITLPIIGTASCGLYHARCLRDDPQSTIACGKIEEIPGGEISPEEIKELDKLTEETRREGVSWEALKAKLDAIHEGEDLRHEIYSCILNPVYVGQLPRPRNQAEVIAYARVFLALRDLSLNVTVQERTLIEFWGAHHTVVGGPEKKETNKEVKHE